MEVVHQEYEKQKIFDVIPTCQPVPDGRNESQQHSGIKFIPGAPVKFLRNLPRITLGIVVVEMVVFVINHAWRNL